MNSRLETSRSVPYAVRLARLLEVLVKNLAETKGGRWEDAQILDEGRARTRVVHRSSTGEKPSEKRASGDDDSTQEWTPRYPHESEEVEEARVEYRDPRQADM